MKGGRSHRPQSHDAHDDWVDGSWTVDCVCGVNFDDGEEMVNCDECGVWVHTRCSRYVKGDELFACDKCKSKNNRNNDSEETEVAQLLVELPTKTIRLESGYAANGPSHRPFRLWTDRPMEERVHVQGIPGGDPALFSGLSSIFSNPELWKCTGYVPKKFNFQYREFPCWDEKEVNGRNEDENENTVDKGAGVLFSLSKESVLRTPATALVSSRDVAVGCDRKVYSRDMKRWEGETRDAKRSQIGVRKERSLLQPVVIHSGKRKKEDLGAFHDQSGKKKARSTEKLVDVKKRGSYISKTAFTSTSDAKPLEFYEDRHPKSFKNGPQSSKNNNLGEPVTQEHESDSNLIGNGFERHKKNMEKIGHSSEAFSSEITRHNLSTEAKLREGKARDEVTAAVEPLIKVDTMNASIPDSGDGRTISKTEGNNMPNGNLDDNVGGSGGTDCKPSVDKVVSVAPAVEGICSTDNIDTTLSSGQAKLEVNEGNCGGNSSHQSALRDGKNAGGCCDHVSEDSKMNDAKLSCSQCSDLKLQEAGRASEAASNIHAVKVDELSGDACHVQEMEGIDSSTALQKCSSEPKHGSGTTEELSKTGGTTSDPPASATHRKMFVCIGKSSSTSSAAVSKSSTSDHVRSAESLNDADHKLPVISECNSSFKKDVAASGIVRDAERNEVSRKPLKERSKSSTSSFSQASNSSKISHTYATKRTSSDSKDPPPAYSSPKPSPAQNSSETSGLLQNDVSHVQNKATASVLPSRVEKTNQSISNPLSKANNAPLTNPHLPANVPATLSDEELALLLHQELNSSPRVPRVPRVRHAGSLPQLASPTATSMLIKRTSSSGGKDYSSVPRRKGKDASKDGFRRSHNPDIELKKSERVASSPDRRRQETGYAADGLSKREENGSPVRVSSMKKNVPPTSTSTANSGPSSSTEVNDHHFSSLRNSPRNISDEETGTAGRPIYRTLPGLINEIMSKGRRMTYEELCNAVLPHWHNLRKHNGERYAYSSHSQAVLDCLRNRQEWARLVDRGPKTNSSRKKRRPDTEESEDNDYGKGRTAESKSLESQREDFPKGKRKARKRRRLALQGRGIKDVRNKRKAGVVTDDDSGQFSNSSEESLFSDDEIQGSGAGLVGSDASASSDEMETM